MTGMGFGKSAGILFALMLAFRPEAATAGYQYNGAPHTAPMMRAPAVPHFTPSPRKAAPEDMSKLAPVFSDLEEALPASVEDEFPAPIALLVPPRVMASPAPDGAPIMLAPEAAPAVPYAAPAKMAVQSKAPKLAGLPATVKISPGQLVINWRNADDLLAQLERVSEAAAEDSGQLEAMMQKKKDPPRDVAAEALGVAEGADLSTTVAGLFATSLNPLINFKAN